MIKLECAVALFDYNMVAEQKIKIIQFRILPSFGPLQSISNWTSTRYGNGSEVILTDKKFVSRFNRTIWFSTALC